MSDWTLSALADAIRARRVSCVEIVNMRLDRIERLDFDLRSFITVDRDRALATARAIDDQLSRGHARGPLAGVPLAYKDLCHIAGLPTSCGTSTREYFIDPVECTAVNRLSAAGAVTIGKLNMTELALGPFGENAHHGDVQNPWRRGHASGGSSSGSGAAVAAGLVLAALGSDTGGSIRLPAACCGIVGLKPTYGRVSRAGVMPLSWSLDHLGPMARTVRDVAILLGVIAGHDPLDATSSRRPVQDYAHVLDAPLGEIRVGLPENFYFDGLDPDVDGAVRAAARTMETLGTKVEPIRLPDAEVLVGTANVLARCESSTIHARLVKDRPHELQPTVRLRLETGFHISAYDYLQALRLRARLTRQFIAEVFEQVDVLIAPTLPEPAPPYDLVKSGTSEERVRRMGRFSRLTRPFNALGLPALSVPCGFSTDGRPLGLQIVGRPFAEAAILRLGHAYEEASSWHTRRPRLDGERL
jgi:aspartyl-tRNA(Asn)/glutamyl-tRNA(Gln) amidotransferase subunit A